MRPIFAVMLLYWSIMACPHPSLGQPGRSYSPAQGLSERDHLQKHPFTEAHQQGFKAVEMDLFYFQDTLYIAENESQIKEGRTLDRLYLKPLQRAFPQQGQRSTTAHFQLICRIRSPFEPTIEVLTRLLTSMIDQLSPQGGITIVLGGNIPDPNAFQKYPLYFHFEGRPETSYTQYQLMRIALFSPNLKDYSRWNGEGEMLRKDRKRLSKIIEQAHRIQKPIRFRNTPDNINTWKKLMDLQVDCISTQRVVELADYLRTGPL
ncbi:hypothetical protein CLV98_11842 [Dyadobacter jejuensis]|uniref:Glycerophosphoryl diester phosphodiesterase family protein n=1 Tax=Dyadobacter jejuensis TaxID=1082580 RepID=A0A316AB84_9BACT|nr:alkaline phosphatase [Dyadobacter jejuensis]PWJ54280.1 hypothetical protein CLV98_11842 [Dyadobacter jejuensis]